MPLHSRLRSATTPCTMARKKTSNALELGVLLTPQTPIMTAVEQGIMRRHPSSRAAAPVAEQIAVRLAGLITIDLIHAGERLLETDISNVLKVSRAPVREALRILERERLVEFQARRGAVVTNPDAKDIADIYVVRAALFKIYLRQLMEGRAAEVEAVFDRHMPALARAAERQSVDDYALESFLLNLDLLALSEGRLIADLLASISLRALRYVRLGLAANPGRIASAVRSWGALQRAVVRRDVEAVLETAVSRINASRDSALHALAPAARPAAGRKGA